MNLKCIHTAHQNILWRNTHPYIYIYIYIRRPLVGHRRVDPISIHLYSIVVQEKEGDEKGKKIAKYRKMFRVRVSAYMYIQVRNFHRPLGWTCQIAGLSVSGRPRIDVFSTLILVRFLVPFSCISEFQNPVK